MVLKVWTESHSQPLIGSRSRRMISTRRSSATRGFLLAGFLKYDNMHYVNCHEVQDTRTSQRPSTPQRLSDDR